VTAEVLEVVDGLVWCRRQASFVINGVVSFFYFSNSNMRPSCTTSLPLQI
jgi:hypothetical protein